MKINQLVSSLPVSSVEVERSFSTMKRTMTYLRNRTLSDRLTNLMILSENKVILESLDLYKVIEKWASIRSRLVSL